MNGYNVFYKLNDSILAAWVSKKLSKSQAEAFIANKTGASQVLAVDVGIVQKDIEHRKYSDAYVLKSIESYQGMVLDIILAVEIKKNELRMAREDAFKSLDAAWFKATEQNNPAKLEEIKQKKEALRAFSENPIWETVSDIEELESITLEQFYAI